MRELVQSLGSNASFSRAVKWGKLVSITGGAQVIVQAIGLISGILVIRLLPTQEYALYTLANTMLGTMTVLADGGISTAALSQGGKVWTDKQKLGSVLITGLDLRKKFAIATLVIAIPILFFLLRHHNASWLMTGLLVLSLIPAFYTTLSSSILQVPPKLHQDIAPLQRNMVESNIGRLLMLLITLFVFPWAFVAILSAGLPQLWSNFRLKKISIPYADLSQTALPEIRNEILGFVKRILPGAVYFCLSGQITIWLISIFGSTTSVAQVGALSRLAMMLSVFNVIFSTLVLPRFARLPDNPKVILNRYIQIQLGLLAMCIFVVGFISIFPSQVLWVLGDDYANLQNELVLSVAGSCLTLIVGASFSLSTSRSWALHPLVSILGNILFIIIGIFVIDISTLRGILFFNIFVNAGEVLMYVVYCVTKILKVKEKSPTED